MCRICFEEDIPKSLISPCRCDGSMAKVHPNCLMRWLKVRGNHECEICHIIFKVRRMYPSIYIIIYRLLKSLWHEKMILLKGILLTIYGRFLYKKLCSLKKDFLLITNTSWFKSICIKFFLQIYYSQLVYIFIKEFIKIAKDIIMLIKETSDISIDNYC